MTPERDPKLQLEVDEVKARLALFRELRDRCGRAELKAERLETELAHIKSGAAGCEYCGAECGSCMNLAMLLREAVRWLPPYYAMPRSEAWHEAGDIATRIRKTVYPDGRNEECETGEQRVLDWIETHAPAGLGRRIFRWRIGYRGEKS